MNTTNKIFILVHGAWHGGWCWHKVVSRLQNLGHHVIAPDLKGETLAGYVDQIEKLLPAGQQTVFLVGHSMAGVVITQVAENVPDKIEKLIYLSAFIPQNGGSLIDEEQQAAVPTLGLEVVIDQAESSISLPAAPRIIEFFYNQCSDEDVAYALARLQKQPLRPFIDPVVISQANFGRVPKLYIECLQDKAIALQDQRRMHSRIKCEVKTLNTDHSPFFSMDEELANLIV